MQIVVPMQQLQREDLAVVDCQKKEIFKYNHDRIDIIFDGEITNFSGEVIELGGEVSNFKLREEKFSLARLTPILAGQCFNGVVARGMFLCLYLRGRGLILLTQDRTSSKSREDQS